VGAQGGAWKVKRLISVVAIVTFALTGLLAKSASADSLGGNGGGCDGFGSIGPAVGAGVGCPGSPSGHPNPGSPGGKSPSGPGQSHQGGGTNGTGDYWAPVVGSRRVLACPNGSGAELGRALQEYTSKGVPIGLPIVVCPGRQTPGKPSVRVVPPPSPGVVWAQLALPTPVLHIDPATVGITQLASWFWLTGVGQTLFVTADIDGYSVTTEASPVAYEWQFGDGATATSGMPGTLAGPSATHVYSDKGTYTVRVMIEYSGSYTYSGAAGTGTVALGDYDDTAASAPYVVQEVRSVLVPTGQP